MLHGRPDLCRAANKVRRDNRLHGKPRFQSLVYGCPPIWPRSSKRKPSSWQLHPFLLLDTSATAMPMLTVPPLDSVAVVCSNRDSKARARALTEQLFPRKRQWPSLMPSSTFSSMLLPSILILILILILTLLPPDPTMVIWTAPTTAPEAHAFPRFPPSSTPRSAHLEQTSRTPSSAFA